MPIPRHERLYNLEKEADRFVKLYSKGNISPKAKQRILETADALLSSGVLDYALKGAKLYEKTGLLNEDTYKIVEEKLKESIKDSPDRIKAERIVKKETERLFSESLDMAKDSKKEIGNVEKKVLTSVFGTSIVAGLYFGISSLTGAVVGMTKASSSFLGIVLFVLGIAGLFFSLKG